MMTPQTVAPECSTRHKFPNPGPGGAISTKKCPSSNLGATILIKLILLAISNPGDWILIKYALVNI